MVCAYRCQRFWSTTREAETPTMSGPLRQRVEQRTRQMGDLVGAAARACVGFRIGQENAHEFPVARIEADDCRDDIPLSRAFPRQLDLPCEGACQVGVERNGDIVPVEEAGFARFAPEGVEREERVDLRSSEGIRDDLVAATHQPVAERLVLMPEIEGGKAVRGGAEAAGFPQQESLEIKLGNRVPDGPPFLQPSPEGSEIVVCRQAMSVMDE